VRGFVGFVVELDHREHGRILRADHKVVAQPIDAIIPLVEANAFLNSQHPRDLHLSEHDVLGECGDQAVV